MCRVGAAELEPRLTPRAAAFFNVKEKVDSRGCSGVCEETSCQPIRDLFTRLLDQNLAWQECQAAFLLLTVCLLLF